ncbi:hypothetical protein FIBSPDRAFT_870621 [Athelia psychrophila]|uniref:RlpA-like protein double-psi beta-barrel domain-containing protein n=1 Tax=Athelia psychrophila TaxID=1759441 RepID=A0A166AZS1_9AGAM|nr:hypothetical protein FIBSPDRAFT_870621 [Fibularhizoctonia sp. CBS 109695]
MVCLSLVTLVALAVSPFIVSSTSAQVVAPGTVHAGSKSRYSRAHSLGETYQFHERDGWQSVNITDMDYKYNKPAGTVLEKRGAKKGKSKKHSTKPPHGSSGDTGLGGAISHILGDVWNGLKAIGEPEPVIITWYTGHDLLNPSCWSNGNWHPTDASFAAALTLDGWATRPKCFKFLELCNSPKKCVFVRVVDTCAGCAAGSKHVDLTRAAFGELASFDEGTLNVQLRAASEPTGWYEDLWGPKTN